MSVIQAWFGRKAPVKPVALEPPASANAERILMRIEWKVLRRLDGVLHGDYRSLMRGFGMDLADLREYQANDDVRFIDWNVTARMDTPYVREFEEDRDVSAWFLVDLSGSMDFGSQQISKRMLASEAVAILARLLTRHGNPVGAMLYSQTPGSRPAGKGVMGAIDRVLPPRHGRQQVLRLIDQIHATHATDAAKIPLAAEKLHLTNLARLIEAGRQSIRRRSVVFVVSDFIAGTGWEQALRLLSQRHDVVAVRLVDPLELALPDIGGLNVQDPETGETVWIDTSDKKLRNRFAQLALERAAYIEQTMQRAGVSCLTLNTAQDLGDALIRFSTLRKLRRRRA